eukprot:1153509-Pelagomonas_calceolata.AAC.16
MLGTAIVPGTATAAAAVCAHCLLPCKLLEGRGAKGGGGGCSTSSGCGRWSTFAAGCAIQQNAAAALGAAAAAAAVSSSKGAHECGQGVRPEPLQRTQTMLRTHPVVVGATQGRNAGGGSRTRGAAAWGVCVSLGVVGGRGRGGGGGGGAACGGGDWVSGW